jgi:hypothetical protein
MLRSLAAGSALGADTDLSFAVGIDVLLAPEENVQEYTPEPASVSSSARPWAKLLAGSGVDGKAAKKTDFRGGRSQDIIITAGR